MSETMVSRVVLSEEARFAAMTASDLDALADLLEADLHYVHANGVVEGKLEFLRKIASGERRYRRFASLRREARNESGFTFIFGMAEVEVDTTNGFVESVLTYTAIYRDSPRPLLMAWHAVKSPGR